MLNKPFAIYGAQRGQRLGVFIDVQNMFYSAKHLYQSKVNYRQLLQDVTAGRQLVRAVAYLVTKPEVDQAGFVEALTKLGYEIKVKYLKIRSDGTAKGDWAMEMSLDIMSMAPQLDTVALITGDGDYVPLIERLKMVGVRTEVVGFPQNTATELMNTANAFVKITEEMLFKDRKFEEQTAARAAAAAVKVEAQPDTEADGNSVAGRFAADAVRAEDQAAGLWGD
jgi:uncharacterized LabA/DUF88 family protein